MAVAFDEMKGRTRSAPAYSELSRWLAEIPPTSSTTGGARPNYLSAHRITFAVYGEADAQERLIPFDVLPRILAARMDRLRLGLEQRVKAINAYIRDVYGRREILKAGIVPEDLVFQNRLPAGDERPEGAARHLRAYRRIDIVRVDPDTFYVLEDNTRTPSGVSYMLENREIMLRLFPELFARHRVAPSKTTRTNCSPRSNRRTDDLELRAERVLLTPGVTTRPITSIRFWPTSSASSLSRRDLFVKEDWSICAPRRAEARRRDLPAHRRRLPRSAGLPPDSALGVPA